MKLLVLILSTLLSLSAFANPDFFIGKYKAKTGKGTASIAKKMTRPANLFEPAVFAYVLELDYETMSVGLSEVLEVSNDGKSLSVSTDQECDDPGCTYFNGLSAYVTKDKKGKAIIEFRYDGFSYAEDGTDVAEEFDETVIFKKI